MWGRRNTYLTFSDNRGQIEREAEGDVCVSISVYASACARVCVRADNLFNKWTAGPTALSLES